MKLGKLGVWTSSHTNASSRWRSSVQRLPSAHETNAARAREVARQALGAYLTLPNYLNAWRRMGFQDEDFANGGSDGLIDEVVAWGDEAAIMKRIESHWEAGADHVCLQAINPHRALGDKGFLQMDQGLLGRLSSHV